MSSIAAAVFLAETPPLSVTRPRAYAYLVFGFTAVKIAPRFEFTPAYSRRYIVSMSHTPCAAPVGAKFFRFGGLTRREIWAAGWSRRNACADFRVVPERLASNAGFRVLVDGFS